MAGGQAEAIALGHLAAGQSAITTAAAMGLTAGAVETMWSEIARAHGIPSLEELRLVVRAELAAIDHAQDG